MSKYRAASWLVFLLLLASPSFAEYFVIKDYRVHVQVHDDSTFSVQEDIDVHFNNPRHGIFRTIPYRYHWVGPGGGPMSSLNEWRKILLYDISAPQNPWKAYKQGDNWVIRFGSPNEMVSG